MDNINIVVELYENVITKDNITQGAVYNPVGANEGNIIIPTVLSHLNNPYQNPDLSGWMQNINQY